MRDVDFCILWTSVISRCVICMLFDLQIGMLDLCMCLNLKKGNRKVQGVPQSQTAALPRPQEEVETDKSKQAQIEQTYEKH